MPRTVTLTQEIRAPIDLVRRQFWDMGHHERTQVHAGVVFEVEQADEQRCRYRQRTRILWMELVDVAENTWGPEGEIVARTLEGPNAGLTTTLRFESAGAEVTRVRVEARVAPSGAMRWLGPLLSWAVRGRFARALEEDRRDIEGGHYPSD